MAVLELLPHPLSGARHSDARWRVLWNGVDVSQELPCGSNEGLGCPEAALLRMLEGDRVPSNG